MPSSSRLLAAAIAAVTVAGCGSGGGDAAPVHLPDGAVAKVGDATVTRSQFEAQVRLVVANATPKGKPIAYEPPDFAACTAKRQKGSTLTASGARAQCREEYKQIKLGGMRAALQAEWVEQEAAQRGIHLSDSDLDAAVKRQRRERFPTTKAYEQYLRDSGRNDQEVRATVRNQLLVQKITAAVGRRIRPASARTVSAYYAGHRRQFAKPERRNLLAVLARDEADARRALKALRDGESWARVAKRYSIDPATKNSGGVLRDYARSQSSKDLDSAVFAAPVGTLEGPVKTQFGWYVFKVQQKLAPSQRSLEQSRTAIKDFLTTNERQGAVREFAQRWIERFTRKTVCADGYKIAECRNGPATDAVPTTPGSTPVPSPQAPQ